MKEAVFLKQDNLRTHGNRKDNCIDCDRENESERLGQQRMIDEILEHADKQLDIIKPALGDFVKNIEKEQPDVIYFLDKSARVFGTPFKKYLDSLGIEKKPKISYFNDHDLKGIYLSGHLDASSNEEKFSDMAGEFRDKKIFFLDETYSGGKGAASIKRLKEIIGNEDIFYFALSQDEGLKKQEEVNDFNSTYGIKYLEHEKVLDEIAKDPSFIIYANQISTLFSREVASLYLDEVTSDLKTTTVHYGSKRMSKLLDRERRARGTKAINVPNASNFSTVKPDSELDMKIQRYQLVAQIKEKIFKTLQSLHLQKD
jgi:hypothetical protein